MRVVFMGTPELAATVMSNIAEKHQVVGVVTRPDAVRGRGKKLEPSPVKVAAEALGAPVIETTSLKSSEMKAALGAFEPDAICVAACGIILPSDVLGMPANGCFNVHTSLLPRWRGAAPMQRSILACDAVTGVSIMRMEEGLDTGAYCKQAEVPLEGVYFNDLQMMLAEKGSELLLEALSEAEAGTLAWTPQPEEGVTYAAKIVKGELDLDSADSAEAACAKVRASDDAHPAHAVIAGRVVTVERAHAANDEDAREIVKDLAPGEALFRAKRLLLMATDGAIEVEALKPQGKKSMDARSFCAGIQGAKKTMLTWGRA